jgi:hypothetical protein
MHHGLRFQATSRGFAASTGNDDKTILKQNGSQLLNWECRLAFAGRQAGDPARLAAFPPRGSQRERWKSSKLTLRLGSARTT